ncbi:MAG: alpha/beta hydrolase [Verrucomicrobia bacterium]|nr:alpha/beta hydrolase [Verrucomicrobiota bacterium]
MPFPYQSRTSAIMTPPRILAIILLLACGFVLRAAEQPEQVETLFIDEARLREIPAVIYPGAAGKDTTKLAVISGGYGMPPTAYGFIARKLVDMGYLVVSVQHQLTTDAPLATAGDLQVLRRPVWERGVVNLRYVLTTLKRDYPKIVPSRTILIGHSNGGDISALFATLYPIEVAAVITLDHRRMPIPRARQPRFMSLRADEFPADPGILPNPEEAKTLGISIIQLKNAKHGELNDEGSKELKERVISFIFGFLDELTPVTN